MQLFKKWLLPFRNLREPNSNSSFWSRITRSRKVNGDFRDRWRTAHLYEVGGKFLVPRFFFEQKLFQDIARAVDIGVDQFPCGRFAKSTFYSSPLIFLLFADVMRLRSNILPQVDDKNYRMMIKDWLSCSMWFRCVKFELTTKQTTKKDQGKFSLVFLFSLFCL